MLPSDKLGSNDHNGKIVTFYSYKGGVGRSMALANVAWILARDRGVRVAVVDWDLEAPGINRFFGIEETSIKTGLVDLVEDYKSLLLDSKAALEELDKGGSLLPDIAQYMLENFQEFSDSGGSISLLASGRQGPEYSRRINGVNWEQLYTDFNGYQFIENLTKALRARFDVILVDSRTGASDAGGICTRQIPDTVVMMFAPNGQNLAGIRRAINDIRTKAPKLRGVAPRIFVQPSRVDFVGESDRAKDWLTKKAASELKDCLPPTNDAGQYLIDIAIPYAAKYSFDEEIAASEQVALPIGKAMLVLADSIWYGGRLEGDGPNLSPAKGAPLIARLHAALHTIRGGQWEKVLASLTLALFGAAAYLRREFKDVPQAGFVAYALGAATALWLVLRVWRRAAPPPPSPSELFPSAIKGLLPFTASDGPLFARLGRRMELSRLLALVQDDQIGISVVRGESGVGKTSLLRAGLEYTLRTLDKAACVYWEAVPTQAQDFLLRAIRSQVPGLETLDALDSLPGACAQRCVLILDQFEQLHSSKPEHAPIFSLLERVGKAPPPHELSVVVGVRREYTADWLDFEQAHGFRAESVVLSLLPEQAARDALAMLCNEAGFALDQAVVTNFISSISSDKGVSPVDVAVGVLCLANFAQQRGISHLGLAEYQSSGGAEGLLLFYVQQNLEEIPEAIRAPLLQGIVLALVDLSNNGRFAAGETSAVIAAKAEVPESSLLPWLERLANPRVRLLEYAGPNRYSLAHDRLVPVLRRLAGRALASVDQLRLWFETEYIQWRATNSSRHLLGGKDLRAVLRQRDQFILGENGLAKAEYLTASLRRRNFLRLVAGGTGIAVAAAAYGAYHEVDTLQQRRALYSWGLPPELFLAQHDLDALVISEPINDFDWLRSLQLKELASHFTGTTLAGLKQAKSLRSLSLDLDGSPITSLAAVEQMKSLTSLTLNLGGSPITSLAGLEQMKSLTSLTLRLGGSPITSLATVEQMKSLTSLTLNLRGSPIASLAGLEQMKGLTSLTLDLGGSRITSLAGLEQMKSLTSLTLNLLGGSPIATLAGLEQLKSLTSLTLNLASSPMTSLAGLEQLKGLTSLTLDLGDSRITSLAGLEQLKGLSSLKLDLVGSRIISLAGLEQLKGLTFLTLRPNFTGSDLTLRPNFTGSKIASLAGLEQLKSLTSLALELDGSSLASFTEMEQLRGLTTLTLYLDNSKITSLAGLEQLKSLTSLTLNLDGSPITSLTGLEPMKGLTSFKLSLRRSAITSLAGLEQLKGLTSLTLDLTDSKIVSLASLEQLKSLTSAELWLPVKLVSQFTQLNFSPPKKLVGCRL